MITAAVEARYAGDASRRSNQAGQGIARGSTLERMREAPLHLAVTHDRGRGGPVGSAQTLEPTIGLYHLGVAIQNLWLAACAEGVGNEWVRLADHRSVARLFDLPCGVELMRIYASESLKRSMCRPEELSWNGTCGDGSILAFT